MLCEFGMPVIWRNTLYNTRVWVLNGQILLIRPKVEMAHGGCNRENRWFKGWNFGRKLFDFDLPQEFTEFFETPQMKSKIGVGVVKTNDAELASEICEELWVPQNLHQQLCLDGVDIISNGSASHH